MKDIRQIENLQILLSHKKNYQKPRGIKDILKNNIGESIFCWMSVLSYRHDEEMKFRIWSLNNLYSSRDKVNEASVAAIYSRRTLWRLWKAILEEAQVRNLKTIPDYTALGVLHEACAAINDLNDTDADEATQYLAKLSIASYRDNVLMKLCRAQATFLQGDELKEYIAKFEAIIGAKVDFYVHFLFGLIERFHHSRSNNIDPRKGWGVDLQLESKRLNVPAPTLIKLMAAISFSVEEGVAFSRQRASNTNDFSLFRDKPFLRLSDEIYLPIEGRLVEELIFENLFHKIDLANNKDPEFKKAFGGAFEKYIQNISKLFCSLSTKTKYNYIEEFSFGKPLHKSPDLFLKAKECDAILVVECKSARYLDSVVSMSGNLDAVKKTIKKLVVDPIQQSMKSVSKIIEKKAHPDISADKTYCFVCVTMNDIPVLLEPVVFEKLGVGASSDCYSFNIETYELLLAAGIELEGVTLNEILADAGGILGRGSIKTALARKLAGREMHGEFYSEMRKRAHEAYLNWQKSIFLQ